MKYYFLKLIPPRTDFMATMSAQERGLMRAHQVHWHGFLEKGWAIAYGPVAHIAGGFGAGFWALPDDQPPEALTAQDPVMKADVGFRYEISPMPALVVGKLATK